MSALQPVVDASPTTHDAGLLDRIVAESRVAQSDQEKDRAKDIIGELVNQVLEGEVVVSESLAASIDARVAELLAVDGHDARTVGVEHHDVVLVDRHLDVVAVEPDVI